MPLNYGESALKDGWQVNATQLFGILLHPDGEVDTFKFMVENVKIDDPNHPVLGTWRQLLFVMIVVTLFASNLPIALRMVFKRPKQLVGWFCLTPPVFALIWGFFSSIGLLYEMANCRQIVWLLAFSLTLSSISNSGIMLQKAYLIMFRQRWVLIVGIIFILPQISIFILTWEICPVTYDVNRGCTFYYPYYLPLIWMAVEAPSCVMFSLIFSYVAYKQYKLFGSDVWKRLARDGILLMCTAILCKLVCGTIVIFNIFGVSSEMFVTADWLISSTILLYNCNNMQKTTSMSTQPKTSHVLNLSQIATFPNYSYSDYDPYHTNIIVRP